MTRLKFAQEIKNGVGAESGAVFIAKERKSDECRELLVDAEVAAVQVTDVLNAELHHRQAGEADAERETAVFFRVDSAVTQDFRVNEAAGDQLDPAVAAGRATFPAAEEAVQVEFETRFDEREVTRAKTDFNVALEDLTQNRFHRRDQVGDRNILVDNETFALIKRVFVARVDRFVTEATAREDRANRGAEALQRADLIRRGVRAQNQLIFEPESVLHIARRVVARDVQRFEAEVFRLDFRTVEDGKAHPLEDVFQFHLRQGDRVERAETTALAGRGQVEIVRFAADRGRFERFDGGGDFGGREIFQFVKTLAEALFFFDRHFAKIGVFREGRDRAFATEVIDANLLDLLRRRRRLQILNEPFLNFLHGNLSQSIQTESRPSRRNRRSGGVGAVGNFVKNR